MKSLLLILSLSLFLPGALIAAVVYSDSFTDGTVDGWVGASPTGTAGVPAPSIIDGTSLGMDGNALRFVSNATQQGPAIDLGQTYTLVNDGDSISLSFDFVVDVLETNNGYFRYGLYDMPGSGTLIDGAQGYFGQISSTSTERGRVVQTDDVYYLNNFEISGADNEGWQIIADTAYSATLAITRTVTGADATVTFSGSASSYTISESLTFPTPNYSFDTIAFGINGGSSTVLFDNVDLDVTVIPEPSSLSLIGIALTGMWLMFRRKR